MPEELYGFPQNHDIPNEADFYVLSNEDIGFIASLVVGTNESFTFPIPYPASMDLMNETMIIHAIEFIFARAQENEGGGGIFNLNAFLEYLDFEFDADSSFDDGDDDDEIFKAMFAGPINFGMLAGAPTASASVEVRNTWADLNRHAKYIHFAPLDCLYPLRVTFVNNSYTEALASGARTAANFTQFEYVYLRIWFTKRNLTAAEKAARGISMRYMQLDS